MTNKVACCVLLLAMCACSPVVPKEPVGAGNAGSGAPQPLAKGAAFFHTFAHSKFHIGTSPANLTSLGLDKVVGDEGVFAIDPRNGSSRAILNATSPTLRNFKPLTPDAAIHNARTLEYFRASGLPAAQVGDIQALPSMQGGIDAAGRMKPDVFTGYASEIYRVIGGHRVPDSFAWAVFDSNGEVVQEAVHWPEISDAVIAEADAFQRAISDEPRFAKFRGQLPAEIAAARKGTVCIRHASTDAKDPGPFVSYDVFVQTPGSRGGVRSFSLTGREIRHPSRNPSGTDSPKP